MALVKSEMIDVPLSLKPCKYTRAGLEIPLKVLTNIVASARLNDLDEICLDTWTFPHCRRAQLLASTAGTASITLFQESVLVP